MYTFKTADTHANMPTQSMLASRTGSLEKCDLVFEAKSVHYSKVVRHVGD